ncbi:Histidine kinase-, DNA gyrase B-, and HSP90-like ATPase [Halorubrum aquaticum]|uniref:histidine kinase n=1 Tax=Halorubrum aquaticum TaxID=387340 RepID=A0A1I3AR00_9EURY|nr:histidine kinase N-terminal 7TM domain-containing protein [Halorubrum aquaticum]SFH52485.1 Histidine kinase-, DNA gyrase B-, and HSP90-like ATPase [Halorubrum aquaticum]
MDPVLLSHVAVFAVSALACVASLPRVRSIRHADTRRGLAALLLSVAVWSVGYVGYLLAPTAAGKIAWYTVGFVFAFAAVGAWLYFCAAYTGRPPRQAPYRNAAIAAFVVLTALKLTNAYHELYFTTAWTTEPFPHLAIRHQVLYWLVLGLSYVVIAVGFFMLLERFHYTGADSRPLAVLVSVTAIPVAATLFGDRVEWLLPLMYEPPGVALFAVGTLFVYSNRLETIRLTGASDKPAIYLDGDGRVRDYNTSAREILPSLADSLGDPIESVNPVVAERLETDGVCAIDRDGESRSYEVVSTPFTVGDVPTGRLVTLTDVTDREAYRRRLEVKTEQLEALNRVVRHDIRNDMAVILGWMETFEGRVDDDLEVVLDRVLRKATHVVELTETAREFVESLSEGETANLRPVDVRETIDAELAAVRESFPDATFRVDGEVPDVRVRGNQMLSSVLRNLLENAVRHNDEPTPEVAVGVETTGETVRISVRDNGPGIPDDRKREVFGKGEKGLDSPGTGIGLYLVHVLTSQFGGEVWVEDGDPKGSVFVVELVNADRVESDRDDADGSGGGNPNL